MRKRSKQLFFIIAGVAFVSGVIAIVASRNGTSASSATASTAPSNASLVAVESSYDFQTIKMQDGNVTHAYPIRNDGPDPITVTSVITSCMCTNARVTAGGRTYGPYGMPGHGGPARKADFVIAAGETATVEAIFDPAAHGPSGVGLAERTITLETTSTVTPTVELDFRAQVTR